MSDDLGATRVDREAIDFGEELLPDASARAVAPGQPAWAGTLVSAPAAALPNAEPVAPTPPPPASAPAASEPIDPTDFAATTHHVRAYPLAAEPPTNDLQREAKILAPVRRLEPDGTVTSSPLWIDRALQVVLVVVVALIVLTLLGIAIGVVLELAA